MGCCPSKRPVSESLQLDQLPRELAPQDGKIDLIVSGAGSVEANGSYTFRPGASPQEGDTVGCDAGIYVNTSNPSVWIGFQDCNVHQHPEWNKWALFNANGVLYAAHMPFETDVDPREGEWEMTPWAAADGNPWNRKFGDVGASPPPTVKLIVRRTRIKTDRRINVQSELPWDKMEGLEAYGEVSDLGELSDGLRRMFREVKVEALVKVDGPVVKMIEHGSIALVRGKYLMHLADTGQPIPRRQDAPPTAFWPRDEAARLFRRSQTEFRKPGPDLAGLLFLGLFLVAFSYCWITPEHPDPHCFHLKRIAAILRAMAKLRAGWDTYDDVGVFWDFLSLHQHDPQTGEKRSRIESDHFSLALSGMQYIYAHDLTCVVKLQHMPPCPQELGEDRRFEALINGERRRLGWHYPDRGWPTFESSVANLSRATQWSRLTFNEEDLGLDGKAPPKTKNPPLLLDFRYKHVTNDPPLHPDTLSELLLSKSFASGSDSAVVLDLYRRTFEKMCAAKVLHFCTFYWPRQLCEHFGEALLAYDQLEHFSLVDGAIGDGRQRQSADPHALRALLRHLPTRTKLRGASFHDMRASAEDIEIFVTAMPPSLTSLALPENPLRDPCATMLARVLPTQMPGLKRLDFKGNFSGQVQFSNAAKQALQKAMPRCTIVY